MQNQNDPKPVQALMGEASLSAIVQKAQILDKINRHLPDLISQQLADYCHVLNLKEGHLILACSNSAIATQIRYREDDLLIKIDRLIPGLPRIIRIECAVRPQ